MTVTPPPPENLRKLEDLLIRFEMPVFCFVETNPPPPQDPKQAPVDYVLAIVVPSDANDQTMRLLARYRDDVEALIGKKFSIVMLPPAGYLVHHLFERSRATDLGYVLSADVENPAAPFRRKEGARIRQFAYTAQVVALAIPKIADEQTKLEKWLVQQVREFNAQSRYLQFDGLQLAVIQEAEQIKQRKFLKYETLPFS